MDRSLNIIFILQGLELSSGTRVLWSKREGNGIQRNIHISLQWGSVWLCCLVCLELSLEFDHTCQRACSPDSEQGRSCGMIIHESDVCSDDSSTCHFLLSVICFCDCNKSQRFGFENKGTEALSSRQVYGCFLRLPTSQRIKGCLCKWWCEKGSL